MKDAGQLTAQALTGDHTEEAYQPKDAIGSTLKATLVTGTGGLFVSAVQNTLTKQNVGVWGVFTKTGGTVATFGACRPQCEQDSMRRVGTGTGTQG